MRCKLIGITISVALTLLGLAPGVAAAQGAGVVDGRVSDSGGGLLPGVLVELTKPGTSRALQSTVTDAQGTYRVRSVPAGDYVVRFSLAGFSTAEISARVETESTVTVAAALQINRLSETVQVVASELKLEATTSTQTATFSNQVLNELPTASRNYTHVIVGEAGVNAPLPDRTGKGLNIATNPGSQGDDASQSLNPSVNGARPTNNGLRVTRSGRRERRKRNGGNGGNGEGHVTETRSARSYLSKWPGGPRTARVIRMSPKTLRALRASVMCSSS